MNTNQRILVSAAVTVIFLFSTSRANGKESSASPIAIYGEATVSCGSFVESKQDETQRYIYLAWLNGYLTAVNKYQSAVNNYNGFRDIKTGRDSQALMLWLDNYCRENPLDNFFKAVLMLQHDLQK